jgi:hypothetical protein
MLYKIVVTSLLLEVKTSEYPHWPDPAALSKGNRREL